MKKLFIYAYLLLLMLSAGFSAAAKSEKRGVCQDFTKTGQITPLEPGVTWFYNWGNTPKSAVQDHDGMEFVPMCWNSNYDTAKIRAYVKAHPDVKYILGFNEPNFKDQANMTPAKAAQEWPKIQALAKELGLKLVSPAVNYSPDAPYQLPISWMREFVSLVGPDAFDCIAIHCYGGEGLLKSMVSEFHSEFGKPIWVTEFCFWPDGQNVSQITQMNQMLESVRFLEQSDAVERYAWFMAIGSYDSPTGPNYGLEVSSLKMPLQLTPQGWLYTYIGEFDRSVYHPVNTLISTSDLVDFSEGIMFYKGTNDKSPNPLDLCEFTNDAYADYQIDVPTDGAYTLALTVSGIGEPESFDPTIMLTAVDADGNEGATILEPVQFALPNSNDSYVTKEFDITLSSGRQTIRLKDGNPYQPSQIRISTLEIKTQDTGVDGILNDADDMARPVEWFDIQGRRVAGPGDRGVYIRREGVHTAKTVKL